MTSSTESSYISHQNMKNKNPEDKQWYDRVYLCWQDTDFKKPNPYSPIKGFHCYRYNSFENADYVWTNLRETEQKWEVRHTMIPMCKWVPEIFDKYILNWKLRNMYWLGKITIAPSSKLRRDYNKYTLSDKSTNNK